VIWLVSGYGPWLAINEGIMSGASAVTGQSNLVKNMAFKTELLPISATLLGIVPLLVSITILTVLILLDGRQPDIAWSIMPVVLAFQMIFVAGLGLILGAVNVFIRDLSLALPTLLTVLLFLSPIFYPISLYPEPIQAIVEWNPFYVIANGYRAPIVDGQFPPWWQLVYLGILAVITYALGLGYFRMVKNYFHGRL
jgi:lipopolysaccharide transport system permease protein